MKHVRVFASVVTLLIASAASAQGGRPAAPPPGTGGGLGGAAGPGAGTVDPAMIVDRFMQGDKNGDGKLSKDELPAPFVERAFEKADANKDGFVDRAELTTFMKAQSEGRGPGGPGAGGPPEGRGEGRGPEGRGGQRGGSFDGSMKQAGRGFKALEKSTWDAASKNADLDAVSGIQAGLAGAKGMIAQVKMSPEAEKKFGKDEAAFRADLRKGIHAAFKEAIALEDALLADKPADAKAAYERLNKLQASGHKLFKAEDE